MNDRDTHFQKFAELLLEDLGGDISQLMDETADSGDYDGHMRLIIAQRAYDLMQSACIDINNAQVRSGGAILHPRAMLREVEDFTEWPPTTAD